jgi:microcystin-dependent protein
MSDAFIGEIKMFGGNFAPRSYAFCSGQLLPIAQFDALFALIGTYYGGDGQTTFALPNLQSRIPVGTGTGPGLPTRVLGEAGGTETVTLTTAQLPAHTHALQVSGTPGSRVVPAGGVLADAGTANVYDSGSPQVAMSAATVAASGGSQPHDNMAPFLCVNFIICLEGIFPSRN